MTVDNWSFTELELNNYELTSGNRQCWINLFAYFCYLWKIISEALYDTVVCVDSSGVNIVMIMGMGLALW